MCFWIFYNLEKKTEAYGRFPANNEPLILDINKDTWWAQIFPRKLADPRSPDKFYDSREKSTNQWRLIYVPRDS